MKKINYSDCVAKFISSGLNITNKLYFTFWIGEACSIATLAFYLIKYFDELDFASLIETETILALHVRMMLYLVSLHLFGSRMKTLTEEINDERHKFRDCSKLSTTKDLFAKIEFFVALNLSFSIIVMYIGLMLSTLFVKSNQYQLPNAVVIIFLPFDEIYSVNWFLNYIFQLITIFFDALLFLVYAIPVLAILNHSCLMFEELIIMAQCLNNLKENPEENSELKLKDFIERSQVVFTRHEEAKGTLQFHFFVEFSFLSFLICFSLYANLIEMTPLFLMMMMISIVQLFIFCFLGERIIYRIKKLEATVYDLEWFSSNVKEQKLILFLLMKIRDTRGFNGIFNSVDMETFLQIVKFIYSMLMVLLSRQ